MKTVILAGGFGSRLWPLSTSEKPKQFLALFNGEPLLLYTYKQLLDIIPKEDLYILVSQGTQHHALEILQELDFQADHLVVVPERRGTLSHVLWALSVITTDKDEPLLFTSVDRYIADQAGFLASLLRQLHDYKPQKSVITVFCTRYREFHSDEGYFVTDKHGGIVDLLDKPTMQQLQTTAERGLNIYRSPFLFITSTQDMAQVLSDLRYDWLNSACDLLSASDTNRQQLFLEMPLIDISSTVFQDSRKLDIIEIDCDFTDVGTFGKLYQINHKDSNGNVVLGNVLLGDNCSNNFIINTTDTPLVVIGQDNCVVVQSQAGNLVSSFKDVSSVGEIYKRHLK